MVTTSCRKSSWVKSSSTESRSSDRKLKPLPPDPFRHQNSAIALGLHLGMPTLDEDGEFTNQPSRAKPVEYDFLRRAFSQGIRQFRHRFCKWAGHAAA